MAEVKTKKRRGLAERRQAVTGALALARVLKEIPVTRFDVDFDAEVDVLYVSFQRPQKATDTVELEDGGVLVHYRDAEIVGVTILDASQR